MTELRFAVQVEKTYSQKHIKNEISKYIKNPEIDVRVVNKLLGLLAFEIWYRIFITKEMDSNEKLTV